VPDWRHIPEAGTVLGIRLLVLLARVLGRRIAGWVLYLVALYYAIAHGRVRRASRDYLRRVGQPATFGNVVRHLHTFARVSLDRLFFFTGRWQPFRVEHHNHDKLVQASHTGRGVLLLGAHLGSFEALRADAQARGERVAMLMYENNARMINATLAAVAPGADLTTIALGQPGAMLSLRRWLEQGGIAGLLADRSLPGGGGSAASRAESRRLPFLGREASFSDGPFRLAALLRRPVIFMTGLYLGGNRYRLRFLPLADLSARPASREAQDAAILDAQQRYVTTLEQLCKEHPYNWFNFYDFWK